MRYISLVLVALLLMGGVAHAKVYNSDYANTQPQGGHGEYNQPYQKTILVRYPESGADIPAIASGDAVIWCRVSNDGVTIETALGNVDDEGFAGIAVSSIPTQDVGNTDLSATNNFGRICVEGYCLASIDSSTTITGSTVGLAVSSTGGLQDYSLSGDTVAILLQDSTAGAQSPVWIK